MRRFSPAPALLLIGLAACTPSPTRTETPTTPDRPPPGTVRVEEQTLRFEEQAAAVGLSFAHDNGMTGALYIVEMMGPGAALFDFDDDGDLDVWFRQGEPLGESPLDPATDRGDRLFENRLEDGNLRFVDVTEKLSVRPGGYGMGTAVGDWSGDGLPDLYLTGFGRNYLLRNLGNGDFADATDESGTNDRRWSTAATFFDYDRDGDLDLFVGNYVDFEVASHKPCFRNSTAPDYCGPMSYRPAPDRLFENLGNGGFTDVTERAGLATTWGSTLGVAALDVDGDGWLDLAVANDAMENFIWRNQGDGTFVEEGLFRGFALSGDGQKEGSMGLGVGDFDGDLDLDLFLTHMATETNTLYEDEGGGLYRDVTLAAGLAGPSLPSTGFGTDLVDLDNDGDLDILATNGAVRIVEALERRGDRLPLGQADQFFENLGDGRFEDRSSTLPALEPMGIGRGAAFGDIDNDGDLDVLLSDNDAPARLLVNKTGQSRDWIGLDLRIAGNRSAPGATVELSFADGTTLLRRSRTDGSYLSASDPRLTIGIGDLGEPDRLTVTWPDGRREEFDPPPLRSYRRLVKGQGR